MDIEMFKIALILLSMISITSCGGSSSSTSSTSRIITVASIGDAEDQLSEAAGLLKTQGTEQKALQVAVLILTTDGQLKIPVLQGTRPAYGAFDKIEERLQRLDPITVLSPSHELLTISQESNILQYVFLITLARERPPEWRVLKLSPNELAGSRLQFPNLADLPQLHQEKDEQRIKAVLASAIESFKKSD